MLVCVDTVMQSDIAIIHILIIKRDIFHSVMMTD